MTEFDVVIKQGTIIDGTGNPWFRTDIGIKGDRIERVGPIQGATAAATIDAKGLAVTPGFFDVHTHSDYSLLVSPFPTSQLVQGVTSEVEGHCGYSAFPLVDSSRGFEFETKDMEVCWSSAREYYDTLVKARPGMNTGLLVGHTVIRAAVSGREDRRVTPSELEKMKAYVREAMEAGALGISTGLEYPPGGSADVEELVSLCEVVAEYGGMYDSHVRGQTGNFVNAVAEALEIGRRANVPVQISHFGAALTGSLELTRAALGLVDSARDEGVDVAIDVIPYGTAGAWWAPRAVFPAWAYNWRVNDLDRVRELLLDPETRARLRDEVEARRVMEKHGWNEEMVILRDWEGVSLAEVNPQSQNAHLVGKNFEEIGRILGKPPVDAYFDLLVEELPCFSTVRVVVDPVALAEMLQKPYAMIGSDSVATCPELADAPFNALQAHPRNYGSFPHVLGDLVRDQRLMTWEDAIRKLTSLPARRFGFKGRGLIMEGKFADLVIFDQDKIAPLSTWRQPRRLPQGIHHVLVNGRFALRDGETTGVRAGQVIRGLM